MSKNKKVIPTEEEVIEASTKTDKTHSERVFNYKVSSEEVREIEVKGIVFVAKFYSTTASSQGIRIPLQDNGLFFDKFSEYCKEIADSRIMKEKEADLIAFTTFGKLDKGLEFFPVMGFYVYPWRKTGKEAHLVFNQEKDAPSPQERMEAFVEYYRKKLGIKIKPKKSSFDSLRALDLTEI